MNKIIAAFPFKSHAFYESQNNSSPILTNSFFHGKEYLELKRYISKTFSKFILQQKMQIRDRGRCHTSLFQLKKIDKNPALLKIELLHNIFNKRMTKKI